MQAATSEPKKPQVNHSLLAMLALIAILNSWGFLTLNPAYPSISSELGVPFVPFSSRGLLRLY